MSLKSVAKNVWKARPRTAMFLTMGNADIQQSDEGLSPFAQSLMAEALAHYALTVFWNMQPKMTQEGLRSACQALRTRGDLAAARLSDRLVEASENAA